MRPLAEFIQLLCSRRIGQVAYVRSHDATLGFVIAGVGRHRRVSEGGGRAAELALMPGLPFFEPTTRQSLPRVGGHARRRGQEPSARCTTECSSHPEIGHAHPERLWTFLRGDEAAADRSLDPEGRMSHSCAVLAAPASG